MAFALASLSTLIVCLREALKRFPVVELARVVVVYAVTYTQCADDLLESSRLHCMRTTPVF